MAPLISNGGRASVKTGATRWSIRMTNAMDFFFFLESAAMLNFFTIKFIKRYKLAILQYLGIIKPFATSKASNSLDLQLESTNFLI